MSGIILIAIIMFVSMLIAYMGDVLGKRIGKKRMSIFGLRPRKTAMVITIITGAVISLGTFAVLISLFAPIRVMLLQMDSIKSQRDSLLQKNDELRNDARSLSDQILTSQNEKEKLQTELDANKTELDAIKTQSEDYRKKVAERETELLKLTEHQKELESDLAKSGSDLKKLNAELNQANNEKITVQGAIATMKGNLNDLEQQVKTKENAMRSLNDEITKKNTEIKKMSTGELAFYDGQRLYGFTISNSLAKKKILDAIDKSFQDFKNGAKLNLNCTIQKPAPETLYAVLEKIDTSRAKESIILVFSKKNSFQGDEIPVEFQVLDQYVVFSARRVVAEERVEKKLNLLEAREFVGKFIRGAETKAFDLGLLRDPFRQMSTFAPEDLNRMAGQIEKHSRPMIVRFIARKDIYRSDYLDDKNLEFTIVDG